MAVFLDNEKADDMLWRDGLFLNLQSYVIIQVRVEFVPIANLTLRGVVLPSPKASPNKHGTHCSRHSI